MYWLFVFDLYFLYDSLIFENDACEKKENREAFIVGFFTVSL